MFLDVRGVSSLKTLSTECFFLFLSRRHSVTATLQVNTSVTKRELSAMNISENYAVILKKTTVTHQIDVKSLNISIFNP